MIENTIVYRINVSNHSLYILSIRLSYDYIELSLRKNILNSLYQNVHLQNKTIFLIFGFLFWIQLINIKFVYFL